MLKGELEAAVDRLNRGKLLLERQRMRVAQMDARGSVSQESKQLLRVMEWSVFDLERHLRRRQREQAEERPLRSA